MAIVQQIKEEPVAFQAMIQAGLAFVVGFGGRLTKVQWLNEQEIGTILAFSAAVLAFLTRKAVTPIANPKTNDGTPLVPLRPTVTASGSGAPQPAS